MQFLGRKERIRRADSEGGKGKRGALKGGRR